MNIQRKKELNLAKLSSCYVVRKLDQKDINEVYNLCKENHLYYEYCPPMITKELVVEDMEALPPGKTKDDKYYVGYFDNNQLIAVMDLVLGYPNEETAYIGFFMTDIKLQGKGIGTKIVSEFCQTIADFGYGRVELAWVKGNPQAERFWKKNQFMEIEERSCQAAEHVIAAERILKDNLI